MHSAWPSSKIQRPNLAFLTASLIQTFLPAKLDRNSDLSASLRLIYFYFCRTDRTGKVLISFFSNYLRHSKEK